MPLTTIGDRAGLLPAPGRVGTLAAAALVAALIVAGLLVPVRFAFLGSELLIAILYASSLNLLMGYGGMLSFGHAAYYAIAAYTSALLVVRLDWPVAAAMLAGPVAALLGAFVFGIFIVRRHGGEPAAFLMLTLAFSQLIFAMLYQWYDFTGGDDGITGIGVSGPLAAPRNYFLFVLAVVVTCLYLLARIKSSPFGITLQAIRDNPERASFTGLSIRRYQLLAFVIAGGFAGVAGTLYAFFNGTVSPQIAGWEASARPFLANVMGGTQSFWGPVLGVLVLETLYSEVARFTEHSLIVVGVVSVLVGMYLPKGLVGIGAGLVPAGRWLRRIIGRWTG